MPSKWIFSSSIYLATLEIKPRASPGPGPLWPTPLAFSISFFKQMKISSWTSKISRTGALCVLYLMDPWLYSREVWDGGSQLDQMWTAEKNYVAVHSSSRKCHPYRADSHIPCPFLTGNIFPRFQLAKASHSQEILNGKFHKETCS